MRTDLHLDAHLATGGADDALNLDECLLHEVDAADLVGAIAADDVQRRRDEPDLDRHGSGRDGLARPERSLDGVDALVRETLDLDVGPDLDGFRRQPAGNVVLQRLVDILRDVERLEHAVFLAARRSRVEPRGGYEGRASVSMCECTQADSARGAAAPDRQLESVIGVAELGAERPRDLLVELLDVHLELAGDVRQDRVDELALLVLLLALLNVLGRDTPLRQVNVACADGPGGATGAGEKVSAPSKNALASMHGHLRGDLRGKAVP
jgi:hypothetical protein